MAEKDVTSWALICTVCSNSVILLNPNSPLVLKKPHSVQLNLKNQFNLNITTSTVFCVGHYYFGGRGSKNTG